MPDQNTTARETKLASVRSVSAMTDTLAKALRDAVDVALKAADPQQILDELTEAWGDGAHDAAAGYMYDELGWRFENGEWFNAHVVAQARAARKAA